MCTYGSETSDVVLQAFVGCPLLADFILQTTDSSSQGGDFSLVLSDLIVQAIQFVPKFGTLLLACKASKIIGKLRIK